MNATATVPAQGADSPRPENGSTARHGHAWLWVMCLIGVDYFSSLAYQPSIAGEVAGVLAPMATLGVVLLTLFGALPVYCYVIGRSPHGRGSIALIERLVPGWAGKLCILFLLGFAATDFVMTRTLSVADAAEHLLHNDFLSDNGGLELCADECNRGLGIALGEGWQTFFDRQLMATLLLGLLSSFFWFLLRRGFSEKAIRLAIGVVAVYVFLNLIVIGSGLWYLAQHQELVAGWWASVRSLPTPLPNVGGLILLSVLFVPQLVLGMSGFELSLVVTPRIRGAEGDDHIQPRGRIRNARKALVLAALIMAVLLMGSAFTTTLLIPPAAMNEGGPASNRALAYLAHDNRLANGADSGALNPLFGPAFGSLYDLATIAILCLAGTSIVTGLHLLLPQFLYRLGMEFKWVHKWGVLLGLITLVNVLITIWYRASVRDQRGAYATGVLVLVLIAALTAAIERWQTRKKRFWLLRIPWYYGGLTLLLLLATFVVFAFSPSGVVISAGFILAIVASSMASRSYRNRELRTLGFEFADDASRFLWESMKDTPLPVLVPHRPGLVDRDTKERLIRAEHQLGAEVEIVIVEVEVSDPSDFYQRPLLHVFREDRRFVIKVSHCVSISHALVALALELSRVGPPPALHFGWSELTLFASTWRYMMFGEGDVPWRVRELLQRVQPDAARRPRVVIG